jgi:hypothetical protein
MDENIPTFQEYEILSILEFWFKPNPRFYIICSDINCKHEKVEDAVLIDYNFNKLPNKYNETLTQGLENIHDILDNKLVSLCLKTEYIYRINQIRELAGDRFYIKCYETEKGSNVFVDIMRKY